MLPNLYRIYGDSSVACEKKRIAGPPVLFRADLEVEVHRNQRWQRLDVNEFRFHGGP